MFERPGTDKIALYGGQVEPLPITDTDTHEASEGLTVAPHEEAIFIGMLVLANAALASETAGLAAGWQSVTAYPAGTWIPFGPDGATAIDLASGEVLGLREIRVKDD